VTSFDDLNSPLSDKDWRTLEAFMLRPGGPNLDGVVGFLTAVATTPTMLMPSTWLPMVLGERELDSREDPVLGLVFRLYNAILDGFKEGSVFTPDPDQHEAIEHWCRGYMMGVNLDEEWLDDFEVLAVTTPIAILSGNHTLNHPDDDDPVEDEEAWFERARDRLPSLVLDAYELLAEKRGAPPPAPPGPATFQRETPKVGRNDPCPCGSGKKYKKCCGR